MPLKSNEQKQEKKKLGFDGTSLNFGLRKNLFQHELFLPRMYHHTKYGMFHGRNYNEFKVYKLSTYISQKELIKLWHGSPTQYWYQLSSTKLNKEFITNKLLFSWREGPWIFKLWSQYIPSVYHQGTSQTWKITLAMPKVFPSRARNYSPQQCNLRCGCSLGAEWWYLYNNNSCKNNRSVKFRKKYCKNKFQRLIQMIKWSS